MKQWKELLPVLLFVFMLIPTVVMLTISLGDKQYEEEDFAKYPQQVIGTMRDAQVVPTSWNESFKTQVKTDSLFFVVEGIPQLSFGQALTAKVRGRQIVAIQDAKGDWHKIY